MQYLDVLKRVELNDETEVLFDRVYPIEPLDSSKYEVKYLIGDEEQELFFGSYYANRLIVFSSSEMEVEIRLGKGYLTEESEEWNQKFIIDGPWQGGDGIFSFNMETGLDKFDQEKMAKTLFIFGDTFVGNFDHETRRRWEPHLMPNNTLGYMENGKVDFHMKKGKYGNIVSYYNIKEEYDLVGPVPQHLVSYFTEKPLMGYLSEYNPESIEITFDLHKSRKVDKIEISNYYDEVSKTLAKRGMKDIQLFGSDDLENWEMVANMKLKMATSMTDSNSYRVMKTYRYFKLVCDPKPGVGNYNDQDFQEGLFGLNKVKFHSDGVLLKDIEASSNTCMSMTREHVWIWLQDGVVIGDHMYFLPLIIGEDRNQPEGMMFKVIGLTSYKTPIVNGELVPEKATQKLSPVFAYGEGCSYYYGAGMLSNTVQAGATNPDGYIYIYGYKTSGFLREMIVARVLAENFEYFDDWEYFDGEGYSKNIMDSYPLLGHVSCELSVSEILEGQYKGKYIAVFTYDVNTPAVAFAIGDSLTGPFTKPQKIYITPEQDIYKQTTYTYNAKAHPSLSNSKKILVSYNTNTTSMDHNMSDRMVYKPRFFYLNEVE